MLTSTKKQMEFIKFFSNKTYYTYKAALFSKEYWKTLKHYSKNLSGHKKHYLCHFNHEFFDGSPFTDSILKESLTQKSLQMMQSKIITKPNR